MEKIEISVGDRIFRALTSGPDEGRTVVLLHGFPQSAGEWRAQLGALGAAGYRCVAPDQRGYSPGARPPTVEAYAIDHLVGDVLDLCDELGAEQVDLVGHDWGAIVAWVLAAQHPERLRTLSAVSVPHPEAFADAYASPSSKQREMSSYIDVFRRAGDGERMLQGDDGRGLQRMFEHVGLETLRPRPSTPGSTVSPVPSRRRSTGTGRHTRQRCEGFPRLRYRPCSSGAPPTLPSPATPPTAVRST